MLGNLRAVFAFVVVFGASACGTNAPLAPTSASPAGTWVGSVADSTGSMMGAGLTAPMMSGMTWNVTAAGSGFSGSVQFPGYAGGQMMVSGVMSGNGRTGTFTMSAPTTSMMGMMSGCAATASGTYEMDDSMGRMHGTYTGSNTCSGPFDHGEFTMMRR